MKILLFGIKSFCYQSTFYFIEEISKELIQLGHTVNIYKNTEVKIKEGAYDVALDFNSLIPCLKNENNQSILESIHLPLFNYLLDHPLYHHNSLKEHVSNQHILCIDQNHCSYVEKYYPHIQSVSFLPLSGIKTAPFKSFSSRTFDLTFTGTYTNPQKVMDTILNSAGKFSKVIQTFSDILIMNPHLTLESLVQDKFSHLNPMQFSNLMHSLFPVDMYVTAYYREKIITTLLQSGVNIHVFGHGWDSYPLYLNPHFIYEGEVPFQDTGKIISNSKVVLNISPWFKAGTHDRTISAMLNGAVSLSDSNSYIESIFESEKDIALYHLNDLGQCPNLFIQLMNDQEKMENIAYSGLLHAQNLFSFSALSKNLLNIFNTSL